MRPVLGILDSGQNRGNVDMEFKFGQMDQDMMVSGEMAWPMDMDAWYMLKVMSMRENGLKIKQMVSVFTLTIMEADTRVNGFRTNNMAMALSNGQMVRNMKVSMNKE